MKDNYMIHQIDSIDIDGIIFVWSPLFDRKLEGSFADDDDIRKFFRKRRHFVMYIVLLPMISNKIQLGSATQFFAV